MYHGGVFDSAWCCEFICGGVNLYKFHEVDGEMGDSVLLVCGEEIDNKVMFIDFVYSCFCQSVFSHVG